MSKLRYHIAVMAAKFSKVIIRLSGRNGTHTPGVVARKICPDFMAQAPKAPLCICVTGTNGKTTVSNMLTDMLEKEGKKVVSNRTGSNIVPGCVTNLLNSVNWLGRCRVDATVFEVDERASRLILPYVKPDYLVVTNLFRDSLKRNAHPDYIFSVIDTYCPDTTKLILNADEQCSSNLKPNSEHVYFGIGKQDDDKTEPYNLIADYTLCPKCGTKLKFNYLRYHHIGNAYCPNCDYKSADADYLATKVDKEGKKLIVREKDGNEIEYALIHDALFNIYNELTVITMMRELGYSSDEVKNRIAEIHVPESRYSETKVGNVTVVQALSKGQSAVSSCRTFEYVAEEPGKKVIMIAEDDFSDRQKSIEFIGWIYDLEYEQFARDDVMQVVCCGPRCLDHRVRALIAGIPEEKIAWDLDEVAAVDKVKLEGVDKVYILYDCDTYGISCKMKQKLLKRLEDEK